MNELKKGTNSTHWKKITDGWYQYEHSSYVVNFVPTRYRIDFYQCGSDKEFNFCIEGLKELLELAKVENMDKANANVNDSRLLVEHESYSRLSIGTIDSPVGRFFVGGELFVQAPKKNGRWGDDWSDITFNWISSWYSCSVDGLEIIIGWIEKKYEEK